MEGYKVNSISPYSYKEQIQKSNVPLYVRLGWQDAGTVNGATELGRMAETVNEMAYKLKVTMEEERRLEKTKNDLITNISHDLRTLLTSTLGYFGTYN